MTRLVKLTLEENIASADILPHNKLTLLYEDAQTALIGPCYGF